MMCSTSAITTRGRAMQVAITVIFSLLLFPHHSSGHDEQHDLNRLLLRKPKREAAQTLQRKRTKRDETGCSHNHKQKKKLVPWSRKKQLQLSRKAYRMAILASLAYYDFLDDTNNLPIEGGNKTIRHNGQDSSWAFSLADDPSPAQYLVASAENYASLLSWGKKGSFMQRIISGVISRLWVSLCQIRYKIDRIVPVKRKLSKSSRTTHFAAAQLCQQRLLKKHEGGKRYNVEWALNNWHEEKAKIRWHDTDLIIASSGPSEIVLAFAGTASPADAVTNIQTLEPASHSGLFNTGTNSTNSTVQGNIHRGFLNAYSRVDRGKIQRVNNNSSKNSSGSSLDEYFKKCIIQQSTPQNISTAVEHNTSENVIKTLFMQTNRQKKKKKNTMRRRNNQVCHSHGKRLRDILLDITTSSLESGHTVHLVGHSLAGSLASIHALDIAMNHADTPIDRLHLWTFGSPEIADSLFFESAGSQSPRVRDFFSDDTRLHRYVTKSEKNCATDVVASITSKSLNRRAVRRLGGVRGNVIHTIEPSFLMCNVTGGELHELRSYLSGISTSISQDHSLNTDFPTRLKSWLGETLEEETKS